MRSHGGGGGSSLPGAAPARPSAEVKRAPGRGEIQRAARSFRLPRAFLAHPRGWARPGTRWCVLAAPSGWGRSLPRIGTTPVCTGAPGAVRVSPGRCCWREIRGRSRSEETSDRSAPRGSAVSALGSLARSPAAAARPAREQLRLSWVTADGVTPQAAARREGESPVIRPAPCRIEGGLFFPSESCNETRKSGSMCQDLRSQIQATLQL